jgi:hypothetical protein
MKGAAVVLDLTVEKAYPDSKRDALKHVPMEGVCARDGSGERHVDSIDNRRTSIVPKIALNVSRASREYGANEDQSDYRVFSGFQETC